MSARPEWLDVFMGQGDTYFMSGDDRHELAAYIRNLEAELTGWRNIGAETPEGLNAIMEMSLEVNRTITIPKIERLQTEHEQLKAELKQANLDALNIAKGLGGVAAERDALREGISHAYQMAGAFGCSAEVLDNYSALANGHNPPHPYRAIPPNDLLSERNTLRKQLEEAENAIRLCPALREWGPSTPEHLASRVAALCNQYDGCVHTLSLIVDERNTLRKQRDELLEALGILAAWPPSYPCNENISRMRQFAHDKGESATAPSVPSEVESQ
jgi:hypothetical protein